MNIAIADPPTAAGLAASIVAVADPPTVAGLPAPIAVLADPSAVTGLAAPIAVVAAVSNIVIANCFPFVVLFVVCTHYIKTTSIRPLWFGGIRIQPTFALVRVVRGD